MRKLKQNTGVYGYLRQLGVLESGTEEEIKQARKNYWRERDKAYKAEKRKAQKREIVLIFPADEINHIRFSAKAKGYSLHNYIRACVKADMSQQAVIPHRALVAEILQAMQQCNNQLDAIKKKEAKGWLVISRTYENVETVLQQTENRITNLLKQPQNLQEIIAEAIKRNSGTLDLLKSIIAKHDNQIHDAKDGVIPSTA